MTAKSKHFLTLAERILAGYQPESEEYREIALIPEKDVFSLLAGADLLRETWFGQGIHLCTIVNAKSGKCSEDCAFCAQSRVSSAESPVFSLLPQTELQAGAHHAENTPIHRFSIVTSGGRLPRKEVEDVAKAISELSAEKLDHCVSLGILEKEDFAILKKAGVSRYHHNLETARSNFPAICQTHTYDERVKTVRLAKECGMSVCSGGLFGTGENDEQALELAFELRDLDVDAIPINFLTPIAGTPLENADHLTPLRCLKIIALFRYVLPDKEILICGGREHNLRELHPFIFHAGASGIMTGNYLTTEGRQLEDDIKLLRDLQLQPR